MAFIAGTSDVRGGAILRRRPPGVKKTALWVASGAQALGRGPGYEERIELLSRHYAELDKMVAVVRRNLCGGVGALAVTGLRA